MIPTPRTIHRFVMLLALLHAACSNASNDTAASDQQNGAADTTLQTADTTGVGDIGGVEMPCSDCQPTSCEKQPKTFTGEGTYYTFADGSGNCSFPATPDNLMVAAMNHSDYDDSALCGACIRLSGPDGTITVRIVDRCPECKSGDVDLSPEAFEKIAALQRGRVPISWVVVPCDVDTPLRYHFKDGSNQWWTAVQIRNHRHPIARFEYRAADGGFKTVPRLSYNYFVEASGMGPGPYTFRVTDIYGNTVQDEKIPHRENQEVSSQYQFPPCN